MLPEEIWEDILKHLDAVELVAFKRVSKCWNEIITRVIEKNYKWYEKCVKDVPEHSWGPILEHHIYSEIDCEDFHKARKHSHVWLSMYKSWIGWNTFLKKTPSIKKIEVVPLSEERSYITCLAATNDIIAIGDSEGHVSFYDISQFTVKPIFKVNQYSHIDDVQIGRKGTDIIAVAINENGIESRMQHWDVRSKKRIHHIQCRTFMPLICANFEYCYTVESPRINADYILEINSLGSLNSRSVSFRVGAAEYIVAARVDGSKVTLSATDDGRKRLNIYSGLVNNEIKELYSTSLNPRTILFHKIFESYVVACIDRESHFGLSIAGGDWKFYDLPDGSLVTDVLYHVGLLILGLALGEVRIFYVKDVNCLKALNFETMESKTLKLDTEPIRSVRVTEYNSNQYIVAVTRKKLHLVKFS